MIRPGLLGSLPPAVIASAGLHAGAAAVTLADPILWPWTIGAVAANHAAAAVAGIIPRSRLFGPNLSRLPSAATARGEVAITFDDGPHPTATPRILEILTGHGARASFFCVAARARCAVALTRAIAEAGCDVENHSFAHGPGFGFLSPGGLARDIGAAQALLAELSGTPPRFFRAPMGIRGPLLEPVLRRFGLSLVSWTRRGRDTIARDPDVVLVRLRRGLAAGDVLLLHDGGPGDGRVAVEILPRLLRVIADRGLRAVSLRQALGIGVGAMAADYRDGVSGEVPARASP